MGRLLLIVSGTIITVALIILFLLLYNYATEDFNDIQKDYVDKSKEVEFKSSNHIATQWIQDLAQKKRPNFSYPVKEIEIELPLISKPNIKKTYRLILDRMDEYKLFCVKQIFSHRDLSFALYSEKSRAVVMVHNIHLKKLKQVVKHVISYGIDVQIENYD